MLLGISGVWVLRTAILAAEPTPQNIEDWTTADEKKDSLPLARGQKF